jgi:hypothetical protein
MVLFQNLIHMMLLLNMLRLNVIQFSIIFSALIPVNQPLTLQEYPQEYWYHGEINRNDAETLLGKCAPNSVYLIRVSSIPSTTNNFRFRNV